MAKSCAGCGEELDGSCWHTCERCERPVHTAIICDEVTDVAEGKYVCSSCLQSSVLPAEIAGVADLSNGDEGEMDCAGCGVRCEGLHSCSVCRVVCHSSEECSEIRSSSDGKLTCGGCAHRLGCAGQAGGGSGEATAAADQTLEPVAATEALLAVCASKEATASLPPRNIAKDIQAAASTSHRWHPPAVGKRLLSVAGRWGYVFEVTKVGNEYDVYIAWDQHHNQAPKWEQQQCGGPEWWDTFQPDATAADPLARTQIHEVLRDVRGAKLPFAFLCSPCSKSSTWSLYATYLPAVQVDDELPVAEHLGPRAAMQAGDSVKYSSEAILILQNQTEHDIPKVGEAHLMGILVGQDQGFVRRYALLTVEEYSPKIVLFLVPLLDLSLDCNPGARITAFDEVDGVELAYELVLKDYIAMTVSAVHSKLQRCRAATRRGGQRDDSEDDGSEEEENNRRSEQEERAAASHEESVEEGQGTPLPPGVSQGKLSKLPTPELKRMLEARLIDHDIESGNSFSKAMAGFYIARDGGKRATMPVEKRSDTHTARQQKTQLLANERRAEEEQRALKAEESRKVKRKAHQERLKAVSHHTGCQ
jgi:hypothetical protein